MLRRALPCFALLLAEGCSGADMPGDAEVSGGNQPDNVVVCDGKTLGELARAKTISAACKVQVAPYLPSSSDDFTGRVVVLGSEPQSDGRLRVFITGTDADGAPLAPSAYTHATVSLPEQAEVSGDGPGLTVAPALAVTPFASLTGDVVSLEFVNDYSATMSIPDLRVVQHIQEDLLHALPPVYEGEVTLFSSAVVVKQTFTSDAQKLLAGVVCDEKFDRELTALYDGMGNGLDSLATRERPVRILMVSTDGLENASVAYRKPRIVESIANDGVFVVMLGALFADLGELKSLAGPRGVYFYTPLYPDLKVRVANLVQALSHGAAVDIPPTLAALRPLRINVAGQSVELD